MAVPSAGKMVALIRTLLTMSPIFLHEWRGQCRPAAQLEMEFWPSATRQATVEEMAEAAGLGGAADQAEEEGFGPVVVKRAIRRRSM